MVSDTKLKACPFCGGKELSVFYAGYVFVKCERCFAEQGARGPQKLSEAEAIAAWNTRPREDALVEALEEIVEWADAYPLGFAGGIFDEPDMKEVRRLLGDDLLTKLSAHNFRHVLNGVRSKALNALKGEQ